MTGIYQHTLDAKGRLFIPAKLREELGETFYVTISPEKCLSAYSQENWDDVARWDEICPLEALPENIAAVMEELDF